MILKNKNYFILTLSIFLFFLPVLRPDEFYLNVIISTYASKAMADMLGFIIVIGILLFRPAGLFGHSHLSR